MNKFKNGTCALFFIAALSISNLSLNTFVIQSVSAQTAIAVTVNGNPITNYDIQRRVAFLKLQQKGGNLVDKAKNELIEEMLKNIEIKRRNVDVDDNDIENAFGNFAEQNNITVEQFKEILIQSDITVEHFREYIRGQIGWGRLVHARYQAENGHLTEQETAHRILQNGGVKPSTNEYTIQQVIFVVPAHRRSEITQKRIQEANNFRTHFQGCNNITSQTKGILDVTVRNLGKFLEPQLPKQWAQAILETPVGKMTKLQQTPLGIETLAVCQIKRVSDDRVAQLIFSIEDSKKLNPQKLEALSEKYLKELRKTAHIQKS
ncbi:SurA N-terminal domain-containing protein [Bartonella sp. A05]|uniref:SurA N-terminal domain-containing protein n=1 Tax=Bartonella sp. A05 TaxID=2967261 RepID=UPI0022A95A9D|nr:peptidylprolyl isomerase [Bartonella sp. A05]MCZ2203784.1 peptidylprolyl isomerase [Bartonella sp. A05]